jgi:hypothetical protein
MAGVMEMKMEAKKVATGKNEKNENLRSPTVKAETWMRIKVPMRLTTTMKAKGPRSVQIAGTGFICSSTKAALLSSKYRLI